MKTLLSIALLFAATPLLAINTGDACRSYMQLGALYEVRSMMMRPYASSYDVEKFIDGEVEQLREPLPDGGYRWVRWVRPAGDPPEIKKGHLAVGVHDRGESDPFESSGDRAFAVRIEVPAKRSLFSKNNRVWVGKVSIHYDADRHPRTMERTIGDWMNPDTSKTFDLEAIADHVSVSLDSGAPPDHVRESLVEIRILQAVPQDDPANPAYETIRSLQRVRQNTDPETIDSEIATVERALFPNAEPLPLLAIVADLHRADALMHSKKDEDHEKGERLLRETLRRLR